MSNQTSDPTAVVTDQPQIEAQPILAEGQVPVLAGGQVQVMAELFLPREEDILFPLDPPLSLVPDWDEERLLARQREMMACLGDPIGEESKPEKRSGLASQQLGIEQRHGLRLLLGYGDDPERLAAHLERCLADPAYGYGPNGDDGRTIAQGLTDDEGRLSRDMATAWLEQHAEFRQAVMPAPVGAAQVDGAPLSMRSLHDTTELESFVPILQRVGDNVWRLGVEGEGKHRDFEGDVWETWGRISETLVAWYDEDNERWLAELKRQAARLPDTIQRAAWGDRLRKDRQVVRQEGMRVVLEPAPEEEDGTSEWPRFLTIAESVGLTRLSGHSFYEAAWDGGLRSRHFELSDTSRSKIPFEHTELAVRLAEALASGERPEPAAPAEVEAAYLRRLFNPRKGKDYAVELGPPPAEKLPDGVAGAPLAGYRAGEVTVTLLRGNENVACAVAGETAVLLRRDERRGALAALQVTRGRVGREPLTTTPLDELASPPSPEELRALCAWAAWLAREVESRT